MTEFLRARDLLLSHRTDYEFAYRSFQWPKLDTFNWALDYFDAMALGNGRPALWVVDESGAEFRISFAEMAQRSNRVANFLRELGVRRGDRILLMLGNEVAIWEALMAAAKLGAVVIPAATLLAAEDIEDRLQRGAVRHAIVGAAHTAKFAGLAANIRASAAAGRRAGWQTLEDAYRQSGALEPDGMTRASDPLLLYFTSGTTAKPKMVLHSHQSYPVGHLSTMYWIGLQPGDVHWNISSPGWAKHAWSCWFAPWNAGATVFAYNYARFHAKAVLTMLARRPVITLCAPPTVWRMLVQDPVSGEPAEAVSAGEPLNPEVIERVQAAWGLTIRDGYGQTETTAVAGNSPGQAVKPGCMGRALPGYRIELLDPRAGRRRKGRSAWIFRRRPQG